MGACCYGRTYGPAIVGSAPKGLGPKKHQYGMIYKRSQILQDDHEWEVTFYMVYHADCHTEWAYGGGKICDTST